MNSAILIIDVQTALFAELPPPDDAEGVIARLNAVAERGRAAGVPVIYIQHERPGTPLAHGEPGWALEPRLTVQPRDPVIPKKTPDSFQGTGLGLLLEALGVDHLVIGGFASEFCVDTTVRRAAALGFQVTLIADGHTTTDKPHLPAAIIRAHENATLSSIVSFDVPIRAVPAAALFLP